MRRRLPWRRWSCTSRGFDQEGQGGDEELCGTSFTKSTVSRLAAALDSELEEWGHRPLEAESYPYLFMNARYEKVRIGCRIVGEGVLVVSAVHEDGFREILAVEVVDVEGEATYQELFRTLKERGLKGGGGDDFRLA